MEGFNRLLAELFWSDTSINYRQLQRVCMITCFQKSQQTPVCLTITTNGLKESIVNTEIRQTLQSLFPSVSLRFTGSWTMLQVQLGDELAADLMLEGVLGFCVLRPVLVYKLLIVSPQAWRRLDMLDLQS